MLLAIERLQLSMSEPRGLFQDGRDKIEIDVLVQSRIATSQRYLTHQDCHLRPWLIGSRHCCYLFSPERSSDPPTSGCQNYRAIDPDFAFIGELSLRPALS